MPAFHPASAEACRPTGPATAETSAPTLKWPDIRSCMPWSFMMNITRSVLLPPICGPQLIPETENGAGALHPEAARQVATPVPCSPPTTNAPFTSLGITATHFAPLSTSLGTPLSGDVVVRFCTVSVALCSSETFMLLELSSVFDCEASVLVCAQAKTPRQSKTISRAILLFFMSLYLCSWKFLINKNSSVGRRFTAKQRCRSDSAGDFVFSISGQSFRAAACPG